MAGVRKVNESTINDTINAAMQDATGLPARLPKVTDLNSLQRFGEIITSNGEWINEFSNLINRIMEVVVWNKAWRNPLEFMFKDGDYGDTIEEIFVNTAKVYGYYAYGDGADQWKRVAPDVRNAIHKMNVKFFSKQTVYDKGIKAAFLSYEGFSKYFQGVITAIYNGVSKSLFIAAKYALARCIVETGVAGTIIQNGSAPSEFTIALKETASNLSFLTTKYNAAGVESFSTIDDLYLFVTPKWDATQDVEVLAYMFNIEKGELPYRKIMIDNLTEWDYPLLNEVFTGGVKEFTEDELNILSSVKAIMCDKNLLLMYDMMHTSEVARNKEKLYENYFFHFWGIMSYSPFANCVAFAEGTPTTTVTGWKNPYADTTIKVGSDNRFYAIPATAYGLFTEQVSVQPVITGTGLIAIPGHYGWYQAVNQRGATATITYPKPANASSGMEDLVITVNIV